MAEIDIRSFIYEIPKTEIHLHLEGLASVDTVWDLIQKHDINLPGIKVKSDLIKRFKIKSLNDFIDLFINVIQNSFHEVEDITLLINDLSNYLNKNNIVYAEIFFAPSKFLLNGFDFQDMIAILETGVKNIYTKDQRTVRFIIDVSRTSGVENAKKNLALTIKYKTDSIIGIGLGGAEVKGPAKQFEDVFKKAKKSNLHLVAHAGEVVGPESIWDAIHILHASRIGHGISAIFDKELMEYLKKKQIPLEICPTSNLFTKHFFKTIEEHPIKDFYQRGLFVTVNSDDPSIFGRDLVDEYILLFEENIFSKDLLINLIRNNIFATFLSNQEKENLWKAAKKIISKY